MTKTFKASGREYQRSPLGAPDGVITNAAALLRMQSGNGEFDVTSESTKKQLKDTVFNAFSASNHEGRLITFLSGTPPSAGASGTRLHDKWTYRIKTVVSPTVVELEGFRAEYAGTGITYVIHAAADFTAATAKFPADTGPTGTGADGTERTNTGPCEWQSLSFPEASDGRLRMYPMTISRRTGLTTVRISDPFDNIQQFPEPTGLQWSLRDMPAYTIPQLFKILYRFLLQCGFTLFQHRGKNNGVGAGGNNQNNVYVVDDLILFSNGEDAKQAGYLRMIGMHRNGNDDGTDSVNKFGMDFAWWSAWDRTYPSISVPASTAQTNQGNGINPLSSALHSASFTADAYAAQADMVNNGNSAGVGPYFSPNSSAPFIPGVKWSHPFDTNNPRTISNNFNTPEGGEIAEIRYVLFGDKDEVQIYLEAPGAGFSHVGLGFLKTRPDAQGNNFKTNFSTANASNALLRIGGGSRGSAGGALSPGDNGTNPATTAPPYQNGDRVQVVGQKVNTNPLIVPGTSHAGEFIDSSAVTNLPGLIEAIGILISDTVANIADASTFLIDDGLGNPGSTQTYEFNKVGGVGGGNIAVDLITGSPTTADQVRDRIRDAINSLIAANYTWNGSTTVTTADTSEVVVGDWIRYAAGAGANTNKLFRITAINPNISVTIENPDAFTIPTGSGASSTRKAKHGIWATNAVSARVDLTNGRKGATGNVLIVDSNQEFLQGTEGMGGGGYAIEIQLLSSPVASGALVGEDPQPLFFFRPNVITTPFLSAPGAAQQGIFRVSNRANHANATYRDWNGPSFSTYPNANGFSAVAELAGMFGPDSREINPNERSGRFSFVTISCRDTDGGQIRGSMRYCRVGSPRAGCYGLRRDREGKYHMLIPFQGRNALSSETTSNELIVALGPMPTAMAFVG